MARILLGWELGANRGHLVRITNLARQLAAEGHEVSIAAQRLSRAFDYPDGASLWQAPIWPRLLSNVGALAGPHPNTMGDILVRVGLDNDDTVPSLILGWDAILAAVRPDAVVADFAPALLCAARGRCPTLTVGIGFYVVPPGLPAFPSLTGRPAIFAERETVERVNRGLTSAGRDPIENLAQIFAADQALVGNFTELDPYADWRAEPCAAPSVAHPVGEAGSGDEIFIYADSALLGAAALWEGLARAALPVRLHAEGASPAQMADLERHGFIVERRPLPFEDIARRSRITMSSGGMGFLSSSLAAGVPVVAIHYDLEKRLNGEAVTRLQLGGHVHAAQIQADAFATSLRQLYQNDSFQRRAREMAPSFRDRLSPAQEETAMAILHEMLG